MLESLKINVATIQPELLHRDLAVTNLLFKPSHSLHRIWFSSLINIILLKEHRKVRT